MYNTDVYGYRKSVAELQSSFDGKVLLLGCGGVGSMMLTISLGFSAIYSTPKLS